MSKWLQIDKKLINQVGEHKKAEISSEPDPTIVYASAGRVYVKQWIVKCSPLKSNVAYRDSHKCKT